MPLNLIFIQPGNYTIDDNGVPGDNMSVIRDGTGTVIFTFAHPADALGFTVSTPGVNITVNFTDSMNAADFTIGSLTDPGASPDSIAMKNIGTTGTVTLVSNTTINEGGADESVDIRAGAIILSAASGIGVGNAIETRTGLFEAETTTGGINIRNTGSVQIGGVAADVDGLDVSTSGAIIFQNLGSIFLTEANSVTAGEVVHGGGTSGNVTLVANGANADIIANVDNGAVTVPRGSLVMTAGRDIQLGTIGADFNNDVLTNGNLVFTAGRDILIDGFADVLTDNFGQNTGANLTFTAGRNIGILNVAGTSASVTAAGSAGGDALITTGPGGALTVNGPGSFGLGSTSGDVIVRADRVLIDGGSGMSAPAGFVSISPFTAGRGMILGSAGDAAAAIELSNAELNRIFTPQLRLGDFSTGPVSVISAININVAGTAPNLLLRSEGNISLSAAAALTVANLLEMQAGDDILLATGSAITATTFTGLVDQVGDDGGLGGIATLNGAINAVKSASGNSEADTLSGTATGDTLNGNAGNDTLRGLGGDDTLNGGTGVDNLAGGTGDDDYFVTAGDTVTEAVGEGFDSVFAGETYVLTAGAEVELLATNDDALTAAISLTGNALNNAVTGNNGVNSLFGLGGGDTLRGLGGNDTLDGGAAVDQLLGGTGDDQYIVTNGDTVTEAVGEGFDTVLAQETFTLTAGSAVEQLFAQDAASTTALTLVGNDFNNAITGNDGANTLNGQSGNDTLRGLGGNDTLDGGNSVDQLFGGLGNDNYFVTIGDVITEAVGEGLDSAFSSTNFVLNAGASVEILATTSAAAVTAINLTGNELNNAVTGNAGANILNGGGAGDTLRGLGGADRFDFTTALGGGNVDLLPDFAPGVDDIALENAVFTGLAAGALAAGAFRIGAGAADADDRIIYNSATGALFFDVDGVGGTAQVQFATLAAGLAVTAGDFVVF